MVYMHMVWQEKIAAFYGGGPKTKTGSYKSGREQSVDEADFCSSMDPVMGFHEI